MAASEGDVYCTLVMSDSYLPGAAVLAHSLRDNGTKYKLACIITLDTLRATTITELKSLYDYVIPVDRIGNPNPSNLYLMNRADLLYAFTKINLWRLTQFRKIVYLDADVVSLRAPDELFALPHAFSAAPDVGWPDMFNSGVMVLTPHMGDFWALKTLAATGDSFDGADQGLLNQYYEHKDWHRLSFIYNCTPSANYQYEPAYRYHKAKISMVHFIGKGKPWMTPREQAAPGAYNELLYRWWAVHDRHLREPASEDTRNYHTDFSAPEPEASVITTEPDPMEPVEPVEELAKGDVEPVSTIEQREFSAPHTEWDATRAPPPADARPEALNFPHQLYDFNQDLHLFRAPTEYPEPPKDMWYEVPKEKPMPEAKPAPIFPWEQREPTKPSRIFVDDVVSPNQTPTLEKEANTPVTPTIKITSNDPWQSFEARNTNAWDQVGGIDRYVRALHKRNRSSMSSNVSRPSLSGDPQSSVFSPTSESGPSSTAAAETGFERRESLILTDFPSEIDRPSLPVTPAPVRRPTFWGGERNEAGNLPSADGVPDQADWDPESQLEALRRNSLILSQGDLKLPERRIPDRDMPPSAADPTSPPPAASPIQGTAAPPSAVSRPGAAGGNDGTTEHVEIVPGSEDAPVAAPAPVRPGSGVPQFAAVDFGSNASAEGSAGDMPEREAVLSPTEHGDCA